MQFRSSEDSPEPLVNTPKNDSSTSFRTTNPRAIQYGSSEGKGESITKLVHGNGSATRVDWYIEETARPQQEHETSISHIITDLNQKHEAQLQQMETDIFDKYTKALAERDTNHELAIDDLRTELNREHKLQLDKKAQNIHANHAGILAKKEAQLQNLTSELHDARQMIKKLKKSTHPQQQHALEDLKANLERDHQAQLHTKTRNIHTNYSGIIAKKDTQYEQLAEELEDAYQAQFQTQAHLQTKIRNIHTNYSGIIAKKDAQYQQVSKELQDAQQATKTHIHTNHSNIIAKKDAQLQNLTSELQDAQQALSKLDDAYKAEIALTVQDHESEKVRLRSDGRAEHEAEIEVLRGGHAREVEVLKEGEGSFALCSPRCLGKD